MNDTTPADEPAQFRDVQVQDVTVDGASAKHSILIDGMTVAEMAESFGITYSRDAYHQNLRFPTSASVTPKRPVSPSCTTVSLMR